MDDLVKAAMAKWPNVPDCRGWLALDDRGQWYMRDARVQAAGPFPQVKGSEVRHDKLRAFIERNYACTPQGQWYFQNGPQRVFVTLAATPWVWRVTRLADTLTFEVRSHSGLRMAPTAAWVDEAGRLYLSGDWQPEGGSTLAGALAGAASGTAPTPPSSEGLPAPFGLVHTQDMGVAADALAEGCWPLQAEVLAVELPARFGFQREP